MMLEEYRRVDLEGGPAYIRLEGAESLREVSTVLFDCDGVLIDARDSYNRSIGRTVSYLAKELLKISVPEEAVSEKVLYSFRKSGGFNNDWDTTYAVLLYLFTRLPDEVLGRLREVHRLFQREGAPNEPYKRLLRARKTLGETRNASASSESVETGLLKLAERADSRGLVSIEEALTTDKFGEAGRGFATLASYPGAVGVSTVTTVFEEFFLGPDLFYKRYGVRPLFVTNSRGLVSYEKPLVKEDTLTRLAEMLGGFRLGVVSGRSRVTAEFTLGRVFERFSGELNVFIEDDLAAALSRGDYEQVREMGKPSPYGLLKAEKGASKRGKILYVGDSKEDVIMVERANGVKDRFIAAGVYGAAHSPKDLVDMFVEGGVYLIAESVNDIHGLLKIVAGEKM